MRKDLIPTMEEFNAMDKSDQISALCAVHECNEKKRKIHRQQYIHHRWNPHPPARFIYWWSHGGASYVEGKTGCGWMEVDSVSAFNCERVREAYHEASNFGLVDPAPAGYEPKPRQILGT